MGARAINKELVQGIQFTDIDVLIDQSEKYRRKWKLERALKLGNLFKHHVSISFVTKDGEHLQTEATIWAVTEEYVALKGGMLIPIRSIYEVEEC